MSEAVVGTRAEQFSVHLENFSGPFDLLLGLISRHKLDVTEIALAARAMEPRTVAEVSVTHIHQTRVSVADQAVVVAERLRRSGSATFRALIADAPDKLTVVARFLALLELFRSGSVQFEQMTPLGEIVVRWTGTTSGEVQVSDEFDEPQPLASEE